MYDDQWDRTCCLKICLYMKETSQSEKTKMTMIWEEWMKMHSCYTLTERTEFALFAAVMRIHWYRTRALCFVRSEKQICMTLTWLLLLLLSLLNVLYKSQCWKMSIKENFTYKRLWWRGWRSELLSHCTKQKITCWQVIRTLSTNLTWTTWKSHADKQFIIQCSFLLIRAWP